MKIFYSVVLDYPFSRYKVVEKTANELDDDDEFIFGSRLDAEKTRDDFNYELDVTYRETILDAAGYDDDDILAIITAEFNKIYA